MNKKRILELAKIIERQPHGTIGERAGFNMAAYSHLCGTPACIAGHAVDKWYDPQQGAGPFAGAKFLLGIDELTACNLFYGKDRNGRAASLHEITPKEAATTLRKLTETGRVDWSHCTSYEEY